MAATPSASTSTPQSRMGRDIQGCFVDTDPSFPSALPITLRIFSDPAQKAALFRLRASIGSSPKPFFLDISPDEIHSLSLHPGPPVRLDFRVATVNFIAPQGPLPQPTGTADRVTLETLGFLAQQSVLHISLPDVGGFLPQLSALCEAVGQGGLRPDPEQSNLKALYRGRGGRVVQADELWAPASSFSTDGPPGPQLPPLNLFSTAASDKLPLPTYADVGSPPPPPSPRPPRNKKRLRTRTPSLSSSSSPDYRTWKQQDLAVGEREKMMAELLRRAGKKEQTFKKAMDDLDTKCARAEEVVARLTALTLDAEEKETVLREAGGSPSAQEEQVQAAELRASQISTASASASASPASTTSISSNISDRIQAYLTVQFDQLRDELVSDYATNESVEQRVSDEVDRVLDRYVEEHQMFDAIREAIDEAMGELRTRVLQAWE